MRGGVREGDRSGATEEAEDRMTVGHRGGSLCSGKLLTLGLILEAREEDDDEEEGRGRKAFSRALLISKCDLGVGGGVCEWWWWWWGKKALAVA